MVCADGMTAPQSGPRSLPCGCHPRPPPLPPPALGVGCRREQLGRQCAVEEGHAVADVALRRAGGQVLREFEPSWLPHQSQEGHHHHQHRRACLQSDLGLVRPKRPGVQLQHKRIVAVPVCGGCHAAQGQGGRRGAAATGGHAGTRRLPRPSPGGQAGAAAGAGGEHTANKPTDSPNISPAAKGQGRAAAGAIAGPAQPSAPPTSAAELPPAGVPCATSCPKCGATCTRAWAPRALAAAAPAGARSLERPRTWGSC